MELWCQKPESGISIDGYRLKKLQEDKSWLIIYTDEKLNPSLSLRMKIISKFFILKMREFRKNGIAPITEMIVFLTFLEVRQMIELAAYAFVGEKAFAYHDYVSKVEEGINLGVCELVEMILDDWEEDDESGDEDVLDRSVQEIQNGDWLDRQMERKPPKEE